VQAVDNVKRDKLFEILQSKNNPYLLLKIEEKFTLENEIKVKIYNQYSDPVICKIVVDNNCLQQVKNFK